MDLHGSTAAVGRVVALWRFPVKSMQGETVDAAAIGAHGIEGDRAWAVVDVNTAYVLTARREPALLLASVHVGDHRGRPTIVLPDGSAATDDESLSEWLGRAVRLERAGSEGSGTYEIAVDFEDEPGSEWVHWDGPAGSFHDSARTQVSLVSTRSFGAWDLRRFRQNVVIDFGDPSPDEPDDLVGRSPEFALVGRHLRAGSATLDVVKRIDRCVMTTRPQPGGIDRDLDVLRTINRERGGDLGVGALVTGEGSVAVGDDVVLLP